MTAASIARLFRAPVPVPVLEAVLQGPVAPGPELLIEDGAARPNPLVPGPPHDDVGAVWSALADWIGGAEAPDDVLLLDGVGLALDAGDADGARHLLRRVALGAVVARTTPVPAEALLASGRVVELLALDRDAVLLLLADAGRAEVEPLLEAPWLQGRLALARGRPEDALVPVDGPWADVVAADGLALTGRVDEAAARLERWFDGGRLRGEHPPLLRGELLRAGARVYDAAMRFGDAAAARGQLEELAGELGEPRIQLAVLLGRIGQGYRQGRFAEARRWLREFDALAARVPSRGLRENADYTAAVLATYGGEDPAFAVRVARSTNPALAPFWRILEGVLAFYRGEPEAGLRHLEEAGDAMGAAAASTACEIALFQGDLARAAREAARLPEQWPLLGNAGQVHRARLAWLSGEEAPSPPRPFVNRMVEALALLLDAEQSLERGALPEALAHAREALALAEQHGLGALRPEGWLLAADAAARGGDVDEARRRLERGADLLPHPEAPAAGMLAAARCVLDDVDPTPEQWAAWSRRRDWRALGLAARSFPTPAEAKAVLDGLPERLRALARDAFPGAADAAALHVGPDWLQPPDGERRDLSRRHALRRLMDAFTTHRVEAPGAPLSVDDLLAAGWPGEQVLPLAGRNRVHVALTTLRGLGLRGLLLSVEGGWALDPEVPVVRHG